jgi:hypothetical protein
MPRNGFWRIQELTGQVTEELESRSMKRSGVFSSKISVLKEANHKASCSDMLPQKPQVKRWLTTIATIAENHEAITKPASAALTANVCTFH